MLATAVVRKQNTLILISYHRLAIVLGTCTYTSFNFHSKPVKVESCYPSLYICIKSRLRDLHRVRGKIGYGPRPV